MEKEEKPKTTREKKEVVIEGDSVLFVSNGKSKHMPKDAKYTISGAEATILVNKGYGEVK